MARDAIVEYNASTLEWTVVRLENGKKVHENTYSRKDLAETAIHEWKSGQGPQFIVE